jgi:hypothetical protein
MTTRLHKISAAISVVVLALGTTACGGSDSSSSKAGTSGAASTSKASAADGELTKASFFTAISTAQAKAQTSHVELEIGAAGQKITAEGDVEVGKDVADTAMRMTMSTGSSGPGKISMVIVDNTLYMNLGQMTQDKFAKVDLDDEDNAIAKQFGSITDQLDPSKQLAQFKDAVTSFEKSGSPQKIDGVEAQPYEVVLDTSKIAALSELSGGATAGVPKTLTYTMFVDSDNLLRRVQADVAGSTVEATYSKWGEPVDVEAPQAGEVSDLDLGSMGSAGA